MLPKFEKGQRLRSLREPLNALVRAANADVTGTGPLVYGQDGVGIYADRVPTIALFQPTTAWTFPELPYPPSETAQALTVDPTPYCTAKLVYLWQWDAADIQANEQAVRSYDKVDGTATTRTVWQPRSFRDVSGLAWGMPPCHTTQMFHAVWNRQSARWESIAAPFDLWRFRLKEDLVAEVDAAADAYLMLDTGAGAAAIDEVVFEVTNPFGIFEGTGTVDDGSRGYAKFMPDNGKWEIIQMECP